VKDLKKTRVITEKPEIKILPFSDRPQRYIVRWIVQTNYFSKKI